MKRGFSGLYLILATVCLLPGKMEGQRREKMDAALRSFTDTEFMKKFRDLKLEAENLVLSFKEQQSQYSYVEVNRVKAAYERTAEKFNVQLTDMKADFLDDRKLRYIQDFPDDYVKGLSMDINGLTSFYQSNLQSTVQDVTDAGIDGNALLLLVAELAKLTPELVSNIAQIRSSVREFDEKFLEDNLIQPYRFKKWDEISF